MCTQSFKIQFQTLTSGPDLLSDVYLAQLTRTHDMSTAATGSRTAWRRHGGQGQCVDIPEPPCNNMMLSQVAQGD